MRTKAALLAFVAVSFLATSFQVIAAETVPYFNTPTTGARTYQQREAVFDGGSGGGSGGLARPRNTLTPSRPANPTAAAAASSTASSTDPAAPPITSPIEGADRGEFTIIPVPDAATTNANTATANGNASNTGTQAATNGNAFTAAAASAASAASSSANSNAAYAGTGLGESFGKQLFAVAAVPVVSALAIEGVGLLSRALKGNSPDLQKAPSLSPQQAQSTAQRQAQQAAAPQTFLGDRLAAQGVVNPARCAELNADADTQAQMLAQRTQDIMLQISQIPSVDAIACTSRTGAVITQAVITLFQSSGFTQRFFDMSILRNLQISVGSSPVAQALIGPINAVLATTMNSIMGSLSQSLSSSVSSAIGGKAGGVAGNIVGGLLGGGGGGAAQAAAANCEQQRLAYERVRQCLVRLQGSNMQATSPQECWDRAGLRARVMAGGLKPATAGGTKTASASTGYDGDGVRQASEQRDSSPTGSASSSSRTNPAQCAADQLNRNPNISNAEMQRRCGVTLGPSTTTPKTPSTAPVGRQAPPSVTCITNMMRGPPSMSEAEATRRCTAAANQI